MKTEFIVTIEGSWFENDSKVTKAILEKRLRAVLEDKFEFLADKVKVKRVKDFANMEWIK